jgi:hypothetical protein
MNDCAAGRVVMQDKSVMVPDLGTMQTAFHPYK